MDTMNIESDFMRKIIASAAEKGLGQALGVTPSLRFNDKITASFDDRDVILHMNVDVALKKEQFKKLLGV